MSSEWNLMDFFPLIRYLFAVFSLPCIFLRSLLFTHSFIHWFSFYFRFLLGATSAPCYEQIQTNTSSCIIRSAWFSNMTYLENRQRKKKTPDWSLILSSYEFCFLFVLLVLLSDKIKLDSEKWLDFEDTYWCIFRYKLVLNMIE